MKKNKGFTLLEMLIIVGIIAALVAIGYPYFRGVMEKNRENADIAAMHSAEALLETAYNTRLIIDRRSAREATATKPLYYDPSGKLTWTRPAPYGQGTAGDQGTVGNQGVTWSCCGDYAYNPANDYRQGVVVCYYTPDTGAYPGIHVHWDCDGGSTATPDPVVKPNKPVFPERPATEPTEGVTDPDPGTNVDPDPDTPGGGGSSTKTPFDDILDTSKTHAWPSGEAGEYIVAGHRYLYNGKIYIAIQTTPNGNYSGTGANPEPGGWYSSQVVSPDLSRKNLWFTEENIDNDPTSSTYGKMFYLDEEGNRNYNVNVKRGDLCVLRSEDGKTRYFIRNISDSGYSDGPLKNPGAWYEIWDCPNNCSGKEHKP